MHDALNAVVPRYRRWRPAAAEEATGEGASAEVALSMAAFSVLASVFSLPLMREDAEPLLLSVLRQAAPDRRQAGLALGTAIGASIASDLARGPHISPFPGGERPGEWRPAPPFFRNGNFEDNLPFMFSGRDAVRGAAPPLPDSPRFRADLEEVRRDGVLGSATRSEAQTAAAQFWAGQSSQRGFLHLALHLLQTEPRPGGWWEEARTLSALTVALTDVATLAWAEKRFHSHWRPITAIHQGGNGVAPDPGWQPLVFTPPHPEYPSGHAADCGAAAAVLDATFGPAPREILYRAMGPIDEASRRFASFQAAAAECAASRVWAGAHFRFSNEEGLRIGRVVAMRAIQQVQALKASPR
ncbi:vanadium-dependent haloperoxidase [Roseomonas sp. CECT 9278]|uniref:vanadium-dependent haloperoxidase n=1 Tax=Roseomonas sp. CECT 9278 TaxID=2845823 RepID=UPI001E4679B9|nr:vanadium-dependent haloperoxidase [Roseomonas sp. CECT 9278]